jgi:hypothetical protein
MATLIAWSSSASAYMGYPLVVDTWLGKPGLVETMKPMGCQLCHVSPQGGTVELKAFGNFLVAQYGLPKSAEEDSALMGVLTELKAANPTLYADMQDGIDPNEDPALTAHELPQPEYGCSTGPTRRTGEPWLGLLLAMIPLVVSRRRSGREAGPHRAR